MPVRRRLLDEPGEAAEERSGAGQVGPKRARAEAAPAASPPPVRDRFTSEGFALPFTAAERSFLPWRPEVEQRAMHRENVVTGVVSGEVRAGYQEPGPRSK